MIRVSCVTSQIMPPAYAAIARIGATTSTRRRRVIVVKDGTSPRLGGGKPMKTQTTSALAVCAAGVLAVTALAERPAANGGPTKLLRMPTVSATQIGFAYANNIWTVERRGGMAPRLPRFHGPTTNPPFSTPRKGVPLSGG